MHTHCIECPEVLDSNVQRELGRCAFHLSLMCKEWTREIRLDKLRRSGQFDLIELEA